MNPAERRRTTIAVEERLNLSSQSHNSCSTRKALVLRPAGMNYFHELRGRRIAEALCCLGLSVDFGSLDERFEEEYDLCVLTNSTEILFGSGSITPPTGTSSTTERKQSALAAILRLRRHCGTVACCLHDCTEIATYEEIQRLCQATGIDTILDFGFRDQSASPPRSLSSLYHFIPNGMTPSEQEAVGHEKNEEERPIPWVFIGHATSHRVALVNNLIARVDPRGFVYMPNLGKIAVKELQQLNQRQYETVLRKCRYHVWYSHHQHFCLESESFRLSLLTGCVPIKVISDDEDRPSSLPFDYLIVRESEAAEKIRQFDFDEILRRFRADFLDYPSLAEGLTKFLLSRYLLSSGSRSIIQSQAA
jgi:hypothetical protein